MLGEIERGWHMKEIEEIQRKANLAYQELKALYPSKGDIRAASAYQIKSVINASFLMLHHYDKNLTREEWWIENELDMDLHSPLEKELNNYLMFVGWGLIIHAFSLFESGMRALLREINSAADATAPFYKLFNNSLLPKLRESTGWSFKPYSQEDDVEEFIKLLSTVRNMTHTNAVYYPRPAKPKDFECKWRDKIYKFQEGKNTDFCIDDVYCWLNDLVALNLSIMKAAKVTEIIY